MDAYTNTTGITKHFLGNYRIKTAGVNRYGIIFLIKYGIGTYTICKMDDVSTPRSNREHVCMYGSFSDEGYVMLRIVSTREHPCILSSVVCYYGLT